MVEMCPMSLAALLKLGGGEVILILALIPVLLVAKRLPEIGEGFWQGLKEFRKALRRLAEGQTRHDETGNSHPGNPVLMALTFILGAACLILVAYEFSR